LPRTVQEEKLRSLAVSIVPVVPIVQTARIPFKRLERFDDLNHLN
jgi:hypothetical protein